MWIIVGKCEINCLTPLPQMQTHFNTFPAGAVCQTLWEKEKLRNGEIFCFPTMFSSVFYYLTFIHKGSPCFIPFPPADSFWRNSSRRLLKTLWPKVSYSWWPQCFQLYLTIKLYLMEISYIFRFLSLGFPPADLLYVEKG